MIIIESLMKFIYTLRIHLKRNIKILLKKTWKKMILKIKMIQRLLLKIQIITKISIKRLGITAQAEKAM